jgi:hypothetical protein
LIFASPAPPAHPKDKTAENVRGNKLFPILVIDDQLSSKKRRGETVPLCLLFVVRGWRTEEEKR